MIKFRFVFICLMAFSVLSSCDRIRATLGMATSADIATAKRELQQKSEDSLARLPQQNVANAVAAKEEIEYAGALDKKFYIIVGSFKKDYNTRSMLAFLKTRGYAPVKISLKNGYDMVSLGGYNNFTEARAEVKKIESWEECPYDVWIYDVAQKLHKE
ncbi:MAG: SPOR domain-containing protein [Bacteroidales bacterium]